MRLASLLLVFGLSSSGLLVAQAPTKKTPEEKKKEEKAAKIASQATKDLKANEYEKARKGFEEAYQLVPYEPGFLLNIGLCYQGLQQYEKAKDTYIKFLANAPADHSLRPKVAAKLAEVDEILKELAKEPKEPASIEVIVPTSEPVVAPVVEPPKPHKKIFGLAGVTGGAALVMTSLSLFNFNRGRAEEAAIQEAALSGDATAVSLHANEMGARYDRAKTTALVADALWISTAALGVVGFVIRPKKTNTALLLTPSQFSISIQF
jgi:tetratricopeptide (TPR) repeat protein